MSTLQQWTSLAQTMTGTKARHPFPPPSPPDSSKSATPTTPTTPPKMPSPPRRRVQPGAIGVRFISDEVKRDHRDLERLYKGLLQAVDEGDDATAAALLYQYSWELARHLVAMQLFIFPGTETRAEQGNASALRRRGELAAIRDHVLHLVDLSPTTTTSTGDAAAAFRAACERLNGAVKQHIRNVERKDLVAIERALDGDESERMARDWASVGGFMPGDGRHHPPFRTVQELLGAPYGEVVRAWQMLPQQQGEDGEDGEGMVGEEGGRHQ